MTHTDPLHTIQYVWFWGVCAHVQACVLLCRRLCKCAFELRWVCVCSFVCIPMTGWLNLYVEGEHTNVDAVCKHLLARECARSSGWMEPVPPLGHTVHQVCDGG